MARCTNFLKFVRQRRPSGSAGRRVSAHNVVHVTSCSARVIHATTLPATLLLTPSRPSSLTPQCVSSIFSSPTPIACTPHAFVGPLQFPDIKAFIPHCLWHFKEKLFSLSVNGLTLFYVHYKKKLLKVLVKVAKYIFLNW